MRLDRWIFARAALLALLTAPLSDAFAQVPPAGTPPPGRGGRGGGGRGRAVQIMMLTSPSFADGASIPAKNAQPGAELSPPLAWTGAPDSIASFALIVHDANAPVGNGLDDVLHWMVWNIPGTSKGLPEGIPQGGQLADGMRQISVTGPYYRGPAAPATGPVHHYVFELFALDTVLTVPAVGAAPAVTRAAVVAAMGGHVRGKAVTVGVFRRAP